MSNNLFNTISYFGSNTTISINTGIDKALSPNKEKNQTENEVANTQQNPTKIYGENWVVMQNRLVHAISNLALNERRLILHLSPIIRKAVDIDPTTNTFVIDANLFAKQFGLTGNHYYEVVRTAAFGLQDKPFWLWQFDKNDKQSYASRISWIAKAVPKERSSVIEVTLLNDVIEMLSVFDRNNPFTKYEKDLIINLSTDGLLLLELVASFENKRNKSETYTVQYIREKFNRVDTYPRIAEFNRNILDKAIGEIKKHTPYEVSYKGLSLGGGRATTHFEFLVSKPNQVIEGKAALRLAGTTKKVSKKLYKEGLSPKQIAKLAINRDQFVLANKHMITDKTHDYYQVFESFKPLLSDLATVNDFNYIHEFLSIKKGEDLLLPDVISAADATYSPAKTTKPKPSLPTKLTLNNDQIKEIANNPHFQYDYPNGKMETGSEEHINYLIFRLGANSAEFGKKPLGLYLSGNH